jgi:hypothetical protein
MATVLEECITEEKHSVVRFLLAEGINAKDIQKKCFLFMLGNVCRVKLFNLGGKRFSDDEEVETEVRKWLRQQSKDIHAAGFDELLKRLDKFINVGGGYVEKYNFFHPGSNITYFRFCILL